MLAVFLLSVSEIADPCCAVFLGHKSVPDTAQVRSACYVLYQSIQAIHHYNAKAERYDFL